MTDILSLIKETGAYKTLYGDKKRGTLSHAYLFISPDGDYLKEYLKIFAKLVCCESDNPCLNCRACRLIDQENFPDVLIYPKKDGVVLSEDVNSLIEESYLKPIENQKKVFILSHAETMNASAQNKLLKTLEEPPKNVHILIGATSEFPLLPTVKSRVKKLEIPTFSKEKLFDALSGECPDKERLLSAISCGDGTLGKAKALYGDENLSSAIDLAVDMIVNMKSSAQILDYSVKISALKIELSEFLSVLELLFRDLLMLSQGKESFATNKGALESTKNAQGYGTGAILNALEKINESYKRKKFNQNGTMLIEWLLFQILEGKYKWQKL
ncbi:MAG: hypothetical protein IJX16_03335 [Clostridia bacterium]|nr:hypothetical protein [Clostridia bacterium]